MKATMIHSGNFFFKYRNQVFPIIIVALFLMSPPPAEIGGSVAAERVKDVIALLIVFCGLALRATVIGCASIRRGKFGDAYRAYCADVPRWMLHFSNFAQATHGMAFNVKRVIAQRLFDCFCRAAGCSSDRDLPGCRRSQCVAPPLHLSSWLLYCRRRSRDRNGQSA
ncbi:MULTISPECIES: hypothetical protein [unclassified Rhizobium]|uniref:hypothetical protein n=1 Tax=unclassified Rhizobium TaxID=2613769 RepID=UPI0010EAB274|nr:MULTISPECIES: hypothetical protein [unclassified Rhizobium]MBB3396258.1 hypothetical protein [Rhizobium sp. BK060]MBB4169436.1 hypothetical protein [Rhizobium sp. BK538]TCM75818.1 hypothetical protein EV291_112120 [Rhizobium sp. BK068]